MRIKKTVSAALAATLVAAGFLAAVATPAAAEPMGPLVPGDVYLFNAVGTPTTLLPSDQILTATKTAGSVNPKSFKTLYIDGVAPADTFQIQPSIRIPQAGVPEDDWVQVPIGAQEGESDGKGGWFLNTTAGDPLVKGELLTWLAAQPNKTGTFPFVVSYCDIDANYLGYARTTITMSLTSADASTYTWTVDSPVWTGGGTPVAADTTLSLGTAVAGSDLTVTATVAPTAAAGTVSFTDNGTPFGSPVAVSNGTAVTTLSAPAAGEHVIGATFTPADTTAYKASTGSTTVTVAVSGDGSIRLDFVAPAAPLGEPGAVTIKFDTAAAVTLTGQRDKDNTRVWATAALPEITVLDTRRDDLLGGWTVNVQASAFNGGTHGTIGSKYLGWEPALPAITKDVPTSPLLVKAGATVPSFLDSTTSTGLSTSQPLATVTTPGRGSTSLKANLNLAVPAADVPAEGTYTSTVTVTLVNN